MKITQEKKHYDWLVVGILTATLWLTVSASYADYPTECPKVDPMNYTVLLPHETDCTKFYACSRGRKILMSCPWMDDMKNRLHFNPTLHVCDYPDHAGCEAKSTTPSQSTESTGMSTGRPPMTSTTMKSTTMKSTTMKSTTMKSTTMGSTTMGSTTMGSTTMGSSTMGPTTMGSPTMGPSTTEPPTMGPSTTEPPTMGPSTTEPPMSTEGAPPMTTEPPSEPTEVSTINPSTIMTMSSSTMEQPASSTESSTNTPPIITTELPSVSAEVSTNNPASTMTVTSSPSESTPMSTSELNDISTNEMSTTTELPSTMIETNSETNDNLIDTTIEDEIQTTAADSVTPVCTNTTTHLYFPHESHPNLYYECKYGDYIRRECQDHLIFDVSRQKCVSKFRPNALSALFISPSIVNLAALLNANVASCNSDSSCERYPHECDCTKYYVCNNGNVTLRTCPSRLNFNPKLMECDLPGNVDCGGDNNNNPNNTIPTECPSDNSGWAVNLPHETNCSLFYKCNWGEKFVLPCRPGLYYNPKLQVCDYPCAAGCTAEGGDGTNTCKDAANPSMELPINQKSILNENILMDLASIDNL